MKSTLIAVCALIVAPVAVSPAFANDKAKPHKPAKPGVVVVHARTPAAKPVAVVKPAPPRHPWVGRTVVISESERDVIRAYVHNRMNGSKAGKFNGVSQGLAEKVTWGWGKLPDGWEKHCVRGKVLPSEIHKRCHSLPDDIIFHLPPPPPGTILLAVGGKVIRVGYPTYEILDVFDVHPRRVDIKASLALSPTARSVDRSPSAPPPGNIHLARMQSRP